MTQLVPEDPEAPSDLLDALVSHRMGQESSQSFQVLAGLLPIPVMITRQLDGMILYANHRVGQTFGVPTPEVLGQTTLGFYYNPSDRHRLLGLLRQQGSVRELEICCQRSDRSSFWASVSICPISFEGTAALLCVFQDITARKQVEANLQGSQLTSLTTVQQSDLYQQVQQLNVDLEQQVQERTIQLQQMLNFEAMLKRITDKVRDSLDESQILQTAVKELALGLGMGCCNAAMYNLDQGASTICYEYTTSMPTSQGRVAQMADYPEIYDQLMQGYFFQFCSIVPNPVRGRVAMLACPIFDNQGILGDLWLVNYEDYVFSDSELRLVQQVANQCAIAIRQARLYQAAQTQVQELEKLNRLKDDFLSTVSHELRTPVSNMKMAIHMLKMAKSNERRERYLDILQTECNREADLINDLLDLQHLEAASYPVSVDVVLLKDWLPSILEPFIFRAQSYQQVLTIDLPADLPSITTHCSSLGRILAELLNNACKYTPAGGEIILSVCCDSGVAGPHPFRCHPVGTDADVDVTCPQDWLSLTHPRAGYGLDATREAETATVREALPTVSRMILPFKRKLEVMPPLESASPYFYFTIQNQAEIPTGELPRIFEKFYRVPNADPWKRGGTGLGLALVRKLVEQLHGKLYVESRDGWTTFTVQLKL